MDGNNSKKQARRKRSRILLPVLLALLAGALVLCEAVYYRADDAARAALVPDESVTITRTGYGYYFDGPGSDAALIFYPGAMVEETAYAPLLRQLAERGVDACLLKVPLHMAVLSMDRAEDALPEHDYARWYVGGHSLGGAVAAICAAKRPGDFAGVVLLAAYPTRPLDESLTELSLYGSEDGVLNRARLEEGRQYAPAESSELVIAGGNHAQFGSYGAQRGDGEAAISPEEQWTRAADFIAAGIDKAA